MLERQVINLDQTFTAERQFKEALIVGITDVMSKKAERELLKIMNGLGAILPTTALIVIFDSERQDIGKREISNSDSRVKYMRLENQPPKSVRDNLELRAVRNNYVEAIRDNPEYVNCELIVVADLDGSNTAVTQSEFRIALNSAFQWDALAANQTRKYRDIESLRHEFWAPNNSFDEFRWFRLFINEKEAWEKSVKKKQIKISTRNPPISVDSAFGGLCIYKRWIFEKFDYSYHDKLANSENSHVTLNRKAKAGGARIFIHPALINSKGRYLYFFQEEMIRRLKRSVHSFPFVYCLPFLRWLRTTLQEK